MRKQLEQINSKLNAKNKTIVIALIKNGFCLNVFLKFRG